MPNESRGIGWLNALEKRLRLMIPSWPNLAARPKAANPRTFERTPMASELGVSCEEDGGDSDQRCLGQVDLGSERDTWLNK